jgi:hypothetical protein
MSDLKSAAKLALEALEDISQMQNHSNSGDSSDVDKAIKALEEALTKQEQGEPVGYWMGEFSKDGGATLYEVPQESCFGKIYKNLPVYSAPQQRTWVGLTDEERHQVMQDRTWMHTEGLCQAIEAKLKEKNNE